jgi:drug/metabolite transporter (DMT)-like permease
MLELAFVLILIAALVHAAWNFLCKSSRDSLTFMWWMYSLGAIGYGITILPITGIYLATNSVLPFLISSLAEAGYVITLARGYQRGDLSLVYPISRGGAPILTAVWSALLGERLPSLGILGILVSVAGVCSLSISETDKTGVKSPTSLLGRGSTWAVACAFCISIYSVSDNIAVISTPPVIYIWWVFFGNTVLLIPFVWRSSRMADNFYQIKSSWKTISVAGIASLLSYLAVLFALRLTSVSYVVTGRALSVLFGAIFGAILLKEKFGKERVIGAALMIVGMVAIVAFGS